MRRLFPWWAVVGGIAGLILGATLIARPGELSDHPGRYFWLFLAVLLVHHFEEVAFPGGVQRWLNETIFHSADPMSPFTHGRALVNDVIVGWGGFTLAAMVGTRLTWLALVPMLVLVFDAWVHVAWTVAFGRYAPGFATALALTTPVAFAAVYTFLREDLISYQALSVAAVLGFVLNASFFAVMRRLAR